MEITSLQELLARKEPLDPELKRYIRRMGMGGLMVNHPLVQSMFYNKMENALLNAQLKYKKEALSDAYEKKDYYKYLFLHERPYRFNAFMDLIFRLRRDKEELEDKLYFELLGDIWIDSENLWQMEPLFSLLFEPPNRDLSTCIYMMDEHDRHLLDPSNAPSNGWVLYRGYCRPRRKLGWSWTTSPKKAIWFAKRLAHDKQIPRVAIAHCDHKDVIAFMNGRGESEAIVDPMNIRVEKVITDFDSYDWVAGKVKEAANARHNNEVQS